jgi:hypothetical protein
MNWLSPIGYILLLLGFILLPFFIGIPILVLGWLTLLFSMVRSWYIRWIPNTLRNKLETEVKESYKPYVPSIKGIGLMLKEMVKIASFVFATALVVIVLGFKFHWW